MRGKRKRGGEEGKVACDPSTRAVPLLGGLPRQFARRSEESTSSKTILAALLFIPQLLTLSSRVPDRDHVGENNEKSSLKA
ncbi:hypothetical protein PoB_006352000 [Plakobranchus ocellatus]|uniref:Uncharacterized protein n=1 Tax=Plakobranchus ocellatus TaxID=259542 RepID=A0AAV4CYQ4_9GAST|nr:hypothetical protein PoB_006352000 [Plakobranchus ocellatus]